MDASRFDNLTRRLADPISRRRLARVLGGAAVGGAMSSMFASQSALAVRQSTASCEEGSPFSTHNAQLLALTFTPEISGKLSEARVKISHSYDQEAGYLVRIVGTDASGNPTLSRVLAKKEIPYDTVLGGTQDLTATFKKRKAAKVVAGKTYAILVTRTKAAFGVNGIVRSGNPCPDGTLFHYNSTNKSFVEKPDNDVVFEAFVGY